MVNGSPVLMAGLYLKFFSFFIMVGEVAQLVRAGTAVLRSVVRVHPSSLVSTDIDYVAVKYSVKVFQGLRALCLQGPFKRQL